MVEKLSITVTDEQARRIRERVDGGDYATASEVIRAALQQWQATEEASYERRIDSIRKRIQAAVKEPARYSSDEVDAHIDELARNARLQGNKKRTG